MKVTGWLEVAEALNATGEATVLPLVGEVTVTVANTGEIQSRRRVAQKKCLATRISLSVVGECQG
jgi:hypothetical protein